MRPLVETDWLGPHLHDVRVIEVDVNRTAYDSGHIEGAGLWTVYQDLLQPDYRIISRDALASLLGHSGVGPSTRVVVYGYAAAMAFWMLTYYGHGRVSLLNGSRGAWIAEGRPLTTAAPRIQPTEHHLEEPVHAIRATHQLVEQALGDPSHRLMDVRSMAEYTGERFWPSLPPEGDQRGGHLPGAVLMPIEATWAADGRFKSPDELRELYTSHGFTPDKEIITYCAVGGRASQAWFVLTHLLGYPRVRVYDGSWVEWGSLPGVPVER